MKNISVQKQLLSYPMRVFFMCGEDEKDFEDYDIEAENVFEAATEAYKKHRYTLHVWHKDQKFTYKEIEEYQSQKMNNIEFVGEVVEPLKQAV